MTILKVSVRVFHSTGCSRIFLRSESPGYNMNPSENPINDNYIDTVKSKMAQIQTKLDEIQTIKDEKCPEKEVI